MSLRRPRSFPAALFVPLGMLSTLLIVYLLGHMR